MRTPAAAIAWELGQRHRWGLAAILAMIVALGAIRIAFLTSPRPLNDVTFALLVPVPLAAAVLYFLSVFTFGVSGDIAARESMYPRRMLTLPVSTAALAGWPMLYGCVSIALLWLAMRSVLVVPAEIDVPRYWPALFAAVLLAWTQALTWMPYALRGMRIVTSIVLLVSIDVVVMTALETKASETTMLLLLGPLLPLAYMTALSAVRRSRRGELPEWRAVTRLTSSLTRSATGRGFRSPACAQLWFEWRQYGRNLPVMVAAVLPGALALLFPFREVPVVVVEIVVATLLAPPFMAIFVAASAGKSSANASESYGITPFVATRPVEDRALVAAKWQTALLSTLAAWAIVIVAVPAALLWADAAEPVVNIARRFDGALGRPRAIVLAILVLAGLVGSTWKLLVQGLYIAMSGRDRAVKGVVFATLLVVTAGFFVLGWLLESRYRTAIAWNAIPWLVIAIVAAKLAAAVSVMRRGVECGAFTRKQLVAVAIAWDVAVFVVYGALAWIVPAILVSRHFLLFAAMAVVPFVRLAAAPLAVGRNRHR